MNATIFGNTGEIIHSLAGFPVLSDSAETSGRAEPGGVGPDQFIGSVTAVRLDVTRREQIAAAVELVESEGRGLWGLVNNAGINVIDPLIEAREEDLEFIFDVNVYGIIGRFAAKLFLPGVLYTPMHAN